jgi:hypothetical protein
MPVCNHISGINSQRASALDQHSNDTCGKPAKYKVGKKNKTALFDCETHGSYYIHNRTDSPWNAAIASELIPLDETEQGSKG